MWAGRLAHAVFDFGWYSVLPSFVLGFFRRDSTIAALSDNEQGYLMENFEAQRAAITAELTQAALLGSDTAKIREKLARLAEREAQAAEAERTRAEAQRQQAEAEADIAARAAALAQEAIERLRADGIDLEDVGVQTLRTYARLLARHEAEIQNAGAANARAQAMVDQVQARIAALSERAAALSGLRLTGQSNDRDVGEAVLVERDLQTLRAAMEQAQTALANVQVQDGIQRAHQAAVAALQAQERAVRLDCLRNRAKAAEAAFLGAVRALVAAAGVAPSQAFTRDPALDRFINFGHL